jgi:hypothetical protein
VYTIPFDIPELRFSLRIGKPVSFLVAVRRHILSMVDQNIFVHAYDARDLRHPWRLLLKSPCNHNSTCCMPEAEILMSFVRYLLLYGSLLICISPLSILMNQGKHY